MIECWRSVEGFPGYEVSDLGRVVGHRGDLHQRADRKGYLSVSLWRDGRPHRRAVQRLVAAAFIGPRPPGCVVRHRDGINDRNLATNLRYGTPTENEADKREHGTALLGEKHPACKLTEDQVRAIRARYRKYSRTDGTDAIAADFGVSDSLIFYIVKRKLWSHIA